MLCGAAVGMFLCVMLCVGLIWSRTFVVSQANEEGLEKYDAILQSSQGYSVSLAVIDWTVRKFPKTATILPGGHIWGISSAKEEEEEEEYDEDERGVWGH